MYAGGAVLGIVGGRCDVPFFNGEAILDENMLFWVLLYAFVVVLISDYNTRFQTIMVTIIWAF